MSSDSPENDFCFVTGKHIPVGQSCRFTFEFDAWVSEEGQQIVYASSPSDETELSIIHKEWMYQDSQESLNKLSELDEELGLL